MQSPGWQLWVNNRQLSQWCHLTTTNTIQFVFLFLFKFWIPSRVKITIAFIGMRQAKTDGLWYLFSNSINVQMSYCGYSHRQSIGFQAPRMVTAWKVATDRNLCLQITMLESWYSHKCHKLFGFANKKFMLVTKSQVVHFVNDQIFFSEIMLVKTFSVLWLWFHF